MVKDLEFFVEFNFYLGALSNVIIPEHNAINPFVADPALILLISKHLPLAASWYVIFVSDPSLEYQFRLIISHQLAASTIPVNAFGIEVRDLFLFLDLRSFNTISDSLVDRVLKD